MGWGAEISPLLRYRQLLQMLKQFPEETWRQQFPIQGLKPQLCHWLDVCLGFFVSLGLSLLICKVGVIVKIKERTDVKYEGRAA